MYPECIKKIIESFKKLPGIGEKSAERMAFSVLGFDSENLDEFAKAIEDVKNIKRCPVCNNITDYFLSTSTMWKHSMVSPSLMSL